MSVIPIPSPALQVLQTLAKETQEADHAVSVALDFANRTKAREIAIQAALCSALGITDGTVTLDMKAGAFVVNAVAGEVANSDTGS